MTKQEIAHQEGRHKEPALYASGYPGIEHCRFCERKLKRQRLKNDRAFEYELNVELDREQEERLSHLESLYALNGWGGVLSA